MTKILSVTQWPGLIGMVMEIWSCPSVIMADLLCCITTRKDPGRAIDLNAGNVDTRIVAWGDWDSDGDLDLAVGNSSETPVQVYENTNGLLALAWTAPYAENTRSVAWGDIDGDGDLDLAVGNGEEGGGLANRVYLNTGGRPGSMGGFRGSPSCGYLCCGLGRLRWRRRPRPGCR